MSLQRVALDYFMGMRVKPMTAGGVDLDRLRAGDSPEPPQSRTYDCTYETSLLGGVPVTFVRPPRTESPELIVHLHGGVYVAGIGEPHWWLLSRLCSETGRLGVMVDYRLAPEHPFPAALDDAIDVLEGLALEHGAHHIVLSGDSAGGGLAIASAMKLRDDGRPGPGKLVLLSPWLDITLDHPDIAALEPMDRMLGKAGLVEAAEWYAGDHDPKMPYLSPITGDLNGLPPMLLQVGTHEILLPDARLWRDRAVAQGIDLTYREYSKLFHVWQIFFPILPEGEAAMQEIINFIRQA